MVCCVVVAMMFALPFILIRGLRSLVAGNTCSMAWRPDNQRLSVAGVGAVEAVSVDFSSGVSDKAGSGYLESDEPRQDNRVCLDREFSVIDRARSFRYAGRGAIRLLRFEHSAWIQLSIAGVAIVLAVVLNITAADWRWIIVACGLVLSLEGLNTAVERTCDRISVAYCGQIKVAKDVAAGAVLLGSIAAALLGLLTFLPYLANSDIESAGNNNTIGSANGAASVASADTDNSRFAIFHCINPLVVSKTEVSKTKVSETKVFEPVFSKTVRSGIHVKAVM